MGSPSANSESAAHSGELKPLANLVCQRIEFFVRSLWFSERLLEMRFSRVLPVLLFFACGCSSANVPETGEVSGTVTIDGKPAVGLQVRFSPVGPGRSSIGTTDDSGYYTLTYSLHGTGALIGKHVVSIANQEQGADVPEPGKKAVMKPSQIPKKYADVTKDVEVKAGSNTIDITYP
jgi:hypothetical protein